jgi:arylsulfatase A-like enzyme
VRGASSDHLVSHVDLLPTFLDAAGLPADAALPGRSLIDLCRGRTADWRTHVGSETFGSHLPTTQLTLRSADWTYGFNAGGEDEIYHRLSDPDETANRIDDPTCAQALAEMRTAMLTWMEETHMHPHAQRAFRTLRLGGRAAVGQH